MFLASRRTRASTRMVTIFSLIHSSWPPAILTPAMMMAGFRGGRGPTPRVSGAEQLPLTIGVGKALLKFGTPIAVGL